MVDGITDSMDMNLSKLWEIVKYREAWHAVVHGVGKSWPKAQHSENKDHGIQSRHFMANRWINSGSRGRIYFFGLQNHCRW